MIEQHSNQLTLTFPSPEAAAAFARFLTTLPQSSPLSSPPAGAISSLPSEPYPETRPAADLDLTANLPAPPSSTPPPPPAPPTTRSRHVLLTPERQDQLFNQRQSGQTAHQRLLRAQTTLRDGVLPFSRPGQPPPPSGQPSPRLRAQQEGGFADGAPGVWPEAERRGRSQLRPVPMPLSSPEK